MATNNQNQKSTNKTVVPESAKIMTNAAMWLEGNSAVIVIPDLNKKIRLSSTGASYIVAGGDGNTPLPEPFTHIKLILTVITKQGVGE
jgi:hypothetical protein